MTDLLTSISQYIPVSESLARELSARLKRVDFSKGELIHSADQICGNSYFIKKGILRLYFIKDGQEITEAFSAEGEWINSPRSFMQQKLDIYYLDAIEASDVFVLPLNDLGYLFDHFPEMERYSRLSMGGIMGHMMERMASLRFTTAREKYDHFCENYASIQHRLPIGMIASYLGIARETLSRLRRKS